MKKICILILGFISIHFSSYSQSIEKCDTILNAVVIFQQNVVTVTRIGGLTSYLDYIKLLENNSLDPHIINQFQNRAFQQTRTGDFKERIKNAIITAIPKDKLKGINRINMGIILSLSGHIELISVYQTKNMIKQWTAEDYYKMDKTLKEDMFYAPWKEPIPYCYFHESIQIAD